MDGFLSFISLPRVSYCASCGYFSTLHQTIIQFLQTLMKQNIEEQSQYCYIITAI